MFYIGSVLLSLAVVDFVMAAVLTLFWRLHTQSRGFREIAASMAVSSAGALFSGIGASTADWFFGYAGVVLFVVAMVLMARAMRRLQGLRPLYALEIVIIVVCAVADSYFIIGRQAISGAMVVNSVAFVILATVTARNLYLERRLALKPGCRILAFTFALFAIANLVRAVFRTFYEIPRPVTEEIISFDLMFVILGIAITISWSLAFLWTSYYVAEYKLRTANESLARFSGAVAHDLNTPLNAIIGYLDAVDHLPPDADEKLKVQFVKSARDAAKSMSVFIHDLLEQSRLTRLERAGDVVDTASCVTNALQPLRSRIEAAGAEVHVDELHPVTADAFQITRVFQNLLENAYKYRSDERRLSIHITSNRTDGWVFLSVKDNGRGIAAAEQNTIFESYRRASGNGAVPGYGLGLSECRSILESFEGSIAVLSTPGDGTTFTMKLPAATTGGV